MRDGYAVLSGEMSCTLFTAKPSRSITLLPRPALGSSANMPKVVRRFFKFHSNRLTGYVWWLMPSWQADSLKEAPVFAFAPGRATNAVETFAGWSEFSELIYSLGIKERY